MTQTTEDSVLDGRVRLLQPAEGYRAAIDPVFLAAAATVRPGQRLLDVGAGVGTAALCVAARQSACRVVGLELQAELAELAQRNAELNGFDERVRMVQGDLDDPPPSVLGGGFDHVITNPPYYDGGSVSPHAGKAAAHHEEVPLDRWLRLCLSLLAHKGALVVIHRAERLDDILATLHGGAGAIAILPLWPKRGRAAKRVLVRARKGLRSPTRLLPGLVLHRDDGGYTPAAEAVLRLGEGIDWEV